MKNLRRVVAVIALLCAANLSFAQDVKLHVNPRWKECSFQLDPSLTQAAWHQFTREAGLVAYFRPLIDAKPMGAKHFELSLLNWQTGIDPKQSAWNDRFVHPDSTHVYHLYVVRSKKRDKLQKHLAKAGIGTLIHYPVPPHLQEAYTQLNYKKGDLPIAEEISETCLSLPIWPGMTHEHAENVVHAVRNFFEENYGS